MIRIDTGSICETRMKKDTLMKLLFGSATFLLGAMTALVAQTMTDSAQRVEHGRSDLRGAPGMEVIASTGEYKPGERIDLHLKPRGLRGDDAQDHLRRGEIIILRRRSEVCAEIEQIVLHAGKQGALGGIGHRADCQPDCTIGLVHQPHRVDPGGELRAARAIDQARRPVIPGAGVDPVELDHQEMLRRTQRETARMIATTTIASA